MMEKNELRRIIKEKKGFESLFGWMEIEETLGEGGNSLVYNATIRETPLAVKFLLNANNNNRFKAEYLNTVFCERKLVNCIHYIHMGEWVIKEDKILYIIMDRYNKSLKQDLQEVDQYEIGQLKKLFNQLSLALESLERCLIIHRDLKPENILIDADGNYYISDFGIAHYSENAPIKGHTRRGDRLANYQFSAPEQYNKDGKVDFSSDIYAFAQILYWTVFKETVRGENGKHITEIYGCDKEVDYIDRIIHICLNNDQTKRPQSIMEIRDQGGNAI